MVCAVTKYLIKFILKSSCSYLFTYVLYLIIISYNITHIETAGLDQQGSWRSLWVGPQWGTWHLASGMPPSWGDKERSGWVKGSKKASAIIHLMNMQLWSNHLPKHLFKSKLKGCNHAATMRMFDQRWIWSKYPKDLSPPFTPSRPHQCLLVARSLAASCGWEVLMCLVARRASIRHLLMLDNAGIFVTSHVCNLL